MRKNYRKKNLTKNQSSIIDPFFLKTIFTGIFLLIVLLFKIMPWTSSYYDDIKTYFFKDEINIKIDENKIKNIIKNVGEYFKPNKYIKMSSVANTHYIFPADGELVKNNDGSFNIIVSKNTVCLCPDDVIVKKIEAKSDSYNIYLEGSMNYIIKNVSLIHNISVNMKLKKGEKLGYILINPKTQKGYIQFYVIK